MNRREFLRAAGAGAAATIAIPAAQALAPLTGEQVALILPEEPKILTVDNVRIFNIDDRHVISISYNDWDNSKLRLYEAVRPEFAGSSLHQRSFNATKKGEISVEYYPEPAHRILVGDALIILWEKYNIDGQILVTEASLQANPKAAVIATFSGHIID